MEGNASTVSNDSTTMIVNETIFINAQCEDSRDENLNGNTANRYIYETFDWTTSNPEIGTIKNGSFTANKVGRTKVIIRSTSDPTLSDTILVIVKDIPEIKSDCCFGKIVFLEIKDIGEKQSAFDKIKELERLKYSFCPEEFMTRASAFNMREQIRVSKKAVKNGVTFSDYGSSLIKAYLEFPVVKSVQIIFITDFDRFNELGMICDKVRQTTDALNHILDNVLLDCNTCNLKSICDEVEGMKELHMKNAAKKQ